MPVTLMQRLALRLQGLPVSRVCAALHALEKEGLSIDLREVKGHVLAGGDIERVVDAARYARKKGVKVNLKALLAGELAGLDLKDFVDQGYTTEAARQEQALRRAARADPAAARELLKLREANLANIHALAEKIDSVPFLQKLLMGRTRREEMLRSVKQHQAAVEKELEQIRQWAGTENK